MQFDVELWFGGQCQVSFFPATDLPMGLPVTAVKVLDIKNGRILLVEVPAKGGWDIPGGHVDSGESPEQAAAREIGEETGGIVKSLSLFGYLELKRIILTDLTKPYPSKGIIAMYSGDIVGAAKGSSSLSFETTKLAWFKLGELASIVPSWTNLSQQVVDYAASSQFDISS